MAKVTETSSRKSDHIRINLEEDVRSRLTTGLERYLFPHKALPELDLDDVDLSCKVLGKQLEAPLLISSMTGGTEEATEINRRLAEAAETRGIAMGVGSQRAALEDRALAASFQVRKFAPGVLLFANLGAVQLNYDYGVEECQRAVDMIEADAMMLHLNPLQEAVQPEGDTRFAGLLKKIEAVCSKLKTPVVVKEVGWGIDGKTAKKLVEAGVQAIDVAGAGGTSWTQVEMHRARDDSQRRLAAAFVDWGIPTAQALIDVRAALPKSVPIFASGGIRSGVDIAKCIALGATLGGMASPYLKAAALSVEATIQTIDEVTREIQVCMFASGVGTLKQLGKVKLIERQ